LRHVSCCTTFDHVVYINTEDIYSGGIHTRRRRRFRSALSKSLWTLCIYSRDAENQLC
jgi:hypothetical protein